MTTSLFLLRHGATRLNLEKPYRLQGSERDEPLAPIGVEQARRAADVMRPVPMRAVYSSPLGRAIQTAQLVAAPHALPVIPLNELREGSVGRWENKTWDEIRAAEPEEYQQFLDHPDTHGYAGGENLTEVLDRVRPIFHELLRRHEGQTIAVMGHQIVNRVIIADLLGLELRLARKLKFANGGISLIGMEEGNPVVVSINMAWPAMVNPG